MLKGIPNIISPELLKILAAMGHGDEIVIADGNFPGASLARNLVRLDGHGAAEVLQAGLLYTSHIPDSSVADMIPVLLHCMRSSVRLCL